MTSQDNQEEKKIEWKWAGTGIALIVVFVLSSIFAVSTKLGENVFSFVSIISLIVLIVGIMTTLVGFNVIPNLFSK